MHIEIGIIDSARIVAANAAAVGVIATQLPALARQPSGLVKAGIGAIGVAALMQAWHVPVGPSELHLIGATTVYLLFGFAPTLVAFAAALLLQTLIEPQDFYHIGVNALSLMLPLIMMHQTFGKRLFAASGAERFTLARALRLDATYYAGVAAMVAFWLMISNQPMPVSAWAQWALAYLPVALAEGVITFATVKVLARWRDSKAAGYTALPSLNLA